MNENRKIEIHFLVAGKYEDQRHFENPTDSDWWAHSHMNAGDGILFYYVGQGILGTAIAKGRSARNLERRDRSK
jgi:hypothetical protein